MSAAAAKARRDLRAGLPRYLMAGLAIAVGVAGFSAVLASYAVLGRELELGYRGSSPASATFTLGAPIAPPIEKGLLEAIAAAGGVARVEARRQLAGTIEAAPGKERRLRLFVAEDFRQVEIGRIERQEGAFPPARGEILIERDAFQVLQGKIGDRVRVGTPGGQGELLVAGSVKDVGQAQARMEHLVYGYVTAETLAMLGEAPYFDQIKILAAGDAFDEPHVRRVAAGVERLLRGRGYELERVEVPPPGKHPHADLMATLLLSMAAFGIFVLLLAGIVVVNLAAALMAAQVRQVAVMKTLGGSRRQIAAIYCRQILLLALGALAAGLPAGLLGSRLLCRYLARFLNFDVTSFAVPLWVYALVALVGLLVPLLAAAWPIARATARPVLAALHDHGAVAPGPGGGRLDRLLAALFGRRRPLLLALRNLLRRRGRLLLTLATLSAAGVFFLSALHLRRSLIATIDAIFASRHYDSAAALAEARYSYDQHMLMIYLFLLIVAAVLAAVGGLGLATSMSLQVLERRREIGILRAIGASPGEIRWLFVAEGLALGLASWLLAALLAWPFSKALGGLIGRRLFKGGMAFSIEGHALWIWLLLVLLLAAAASFLPAWRASRAPLAEALAYE